MRKIFFVLAGICLIAYNSFSQCIPDTSITHNVTGIYPDSATGLPHAIVNVPYSTTIQLKVLTDTVLLGTTATVDSIIVTNVSGLPTGFSYLCTPSSGHFIAGSDACVLLTGAAPTSGMVGVYPLLVNVTAYGNISGFPAPPYPYTENRYNITIDQSAGIASLSMSKLDVAQNVPNPFNKTTEISFTTPSNDFMILKVSNLLGKVVYTKSILAQKGLNKITLSSKDFDAGIYIYTVSNSRSSITKRMIVSND